MHQLVPVTSEMDAQWARMKRGIHLANAVGDGPDQTAAFQSTLRQAVVDNVGRCKAERKRAREAETPRDTSNAAIVHAAKFTDALPLEDYNNVLHLVPRLVNVRASVLEAGGRDALVLKRDARSRRWSRSPKPSLSRGQG